LLGAALLLVGSSTARAQTIRAQLVAGGLSQPLDFVAPPGDTSRMFIVQQTGEIRIITLANNTIQAGNFLHLGPTANGGLNLTQASGEQGLLGLAFHPNFASNGLFFVYYTNITTGASVIARYTANGTPSTSTSANTTSGVILRTVAQPFANHNGGHLVFGPDGRLYIGLGDGGSANDPNELAQNTGSLLGKILRLNVDNAAGNYIAADNPSAQGAGPVAHWLDEIWSMGMRNPWRFSFDRQTGDLWIGDVGQDAHEEIDFQPALTAGNLATVGSKNYGWDCREGLFASTGTDRNCTLQGTFTDPIKDVPNVGSTCSISGGFVYRGSAIPSLQGAYFYSDYCGNWVRSLRYDGATVSDEQDWTSQLGGVSSIVAFGEDAAGELYIISIAGSIYKIVPPACGCPCELTPQDTLVRQDNFQTDAGWTVVTPTSGAATDGFWQRGVPVNDPLYANDPIADSDGSGSCWVTENSATGGGSTVSDVDNGTTLLMSPALDFVNAGGGASGGAITICYDYYCNLSVPDGLDGVFAEVSSNGTAGPWVRVASHTSSNGTDWTSHAITQAQLTSAGITSTTNMRVRFAASDLGTQALVEGGIDNFKLYRRIPIIDCNNNGVADAADISMGTSQDCNANAIPDECDIATGFSTDCDGGPVGVASAGASFFNTSCIGCHNTNGTGGTGPNIRNKSRVQIRERLHLIVAHPGGGFPGSTQQDHADLEAFLADAGSRGRPDYIPDSCQVAQLADCDNDGTTDACELEGGSQVDLDYDGVPDDCESACGSADFDGDGDSGTDLDIEAFFACLGGDCCATCGSADFDGDGDSGTDLDIEAFFRVLGGGTC